MELFYYLGIIVLMLMGLGMMLTAGSGWRIWLRMGSIVLIILVLITAYGGPLLTSLYSAADFAIAWLLRLLFVAVLVVAVLRIIRLFRGR